MSAPGPAVRCSGLVKRYPDIVAVDGLDLEVRAGECLGLLGPNGAGKTTTVEMIEGLTPPTAGVVEVFGQRWTRGDDQALRERLGVQLQQVDFHDRLTVAETLRLFRSFFSRGRALDELVALVGLEAKRGSRVGGLSGGQKQRLAIACALAGDPDLLCLDEPTTGLDPQARRHLWEVVETFRGGGGTVLLTTHYMEEAAVLCDRVAIVDRGKIIALDTPDQLIADLGATQIITFATAGGLVLPGLEGLPGVASVSVRGDAARLVVDSVTETMPPLLAELARQGLGFEDLATHRATLEDVFLALTGRALRDG